MTGFLGDPAPRWFTIPAHRPFLEDLADGVRRAVWPLGAQALSRATILVPTRRAALALAEAFLAGADRPAVLLPQIRALGDLDEGEAPFEPGDIALDLPPAISPWRRRFELAGLVAEHEGLLERKLDAGAALEMADALAAFLDGCQIEELAGILDLEGLVEGELARHWQVSARFLKLALEAWPRRLAALGLMDTAARRVALLRRLAERWSDRPPTEVLVAAGSTGTAPAAGDLLAAIAGAPKGCVVLPGLDTSLADDAWKTVGEQHPQGAMKRLLARAGLTRGDVRDWDPATEAQGAGRWRRRLIAEALRPPEATADWLAQIETLKAEGRADGTDPIAQGLAGLSSITARTEEDAAGAVAMLLREVLETPGKTAALITPDAGLARRVSARLLRWNITADSSAGTPLAAAPAAVLASLVARAAVDPVDPVNLLAILKHPLTRLGLGEPKLGRARIALERYGLRGPRPGSWECLTKRLSQSLSPPPLGEGDPGGVEGASSWNGQLRQDTPPSPASRVLPPGGEEREFPLVLLPRLREALDLAGAPFAGEIAAPSEAARGLALAMEALAAGGDGAPWGGPAGEALAGLLAALMSESEALPAVTRAGFSLFLDSLMAGEAVRLGAASHPRLRILGVLEARLIRADRLILAGLEEGVWPQAAPIDPFLSRPMRERLGLPAPERRLGLSAHDFAQAAAAPEVVLVNCERRGGASAVASRWLWRLRTLAKGAGVELPGRPEILSWARALDAPIEAPPDALKTAPRPRPAPPLAARPRKLAVTAIERWVRDPYGVYARYILKLYPLERPDEPVDARARGSAIHAAFERFAADHPGDLPAAAEDLFAALLLEELRRAGMPEARMAREGALAANVAPWVMDFERRRRPGARLIVEQEGRLTFAAPGGPFTVTAKADRLEAFADLAHILDFKTGAAPTAKQVRAGLSPQLTLTGAILAGGGFADVGALDPGDLLYVRVSGGRVPGLEESRGGRGESGEMAAAALAGLKRRVAQFDDPATAYPSWSIPQFIGRYAGDYDHLARLWEWHVIGEGEGEE